MIHLSRTETLALVRKALREAFPETSFTLQPSRSKLTEHGCDKAVFVKWTDGPNASQVFEVIARFEGRKHNWNQPKPWDDNAKVHHLLDGHAVRFDLTRFVYKRELSQGSWDVMVANGRLNPTLYTTEVAQSVPSTPRVKHVAKGTWERQELLDLAAAAMVANGPAPTRIRARL
ncbi:MULTISPECIES: LPD29 domain-containing protein [Burkholderiaceae]|uniref:LPD29 domain-containing protein n=1 Tax=Burkholderiaceae TaxID=119060 RepID=UPI00160CDF0B|nr:MULTISPECIES: LPD29 domain-containing protein [Burkholderiaceae]MBB2981579.1 hypothetical protein [Paraburkholderia tropica]